MSSCSCRAILSEERALQNLQGTYFRVKEMPIEFNSHISRNFTYLRVVLLIVMLLLALGNDLTALLTLVVVSCTSSLMNSQLRCFNILPTNTASFELNIILRKLLLLHIDVELFG